MRFGLNLAIASLAYAALSNGSLLLLSSFTTSGVVGQYAAMSQVAALTSGAVSGLLFTMSYPRLRLAWDKGHSALVRILASIDASESHRHSNIGFAH